MEGTEVTQENVEVEATQEAPVETPVAPKKNGAINHYKEQLAALQQEKADLAAQMESFKTQELEKQERYKELWESEKSKRVEIEQNNQQNYSSFMTTLKATAIEKEATKMGLKQEALQDLDLVDKSLLEIETTSTGKINVLGVNDFMENLKVNRPHWFTDMSAPKVNNAVPGSATPQRRGPSELLQLQKSDPTEYNRIMRDRLSQRS